MDKFTDEDGRMILINIKIENTVFSMVSIYAPNCRTLRNVFFFLNVSRFLKEHGTGIPIIGGDFNETLMLIDRKSKCKNGTFIQPVASLKTFIKTNNLTDIWRKFNQDKQQNDGRIKHRPVV